MTTDLRSLVSELPYTKYTMWVRHGRKIRYTEPYAMLLDNPPVGEDEIMISIKSKEDQYYLIKLLRLELIDLEEYKIIWICYDSQGYKDTLFPALKYFFGLSRVEKEVFGEGLKKLINFEI